jgi:phospholipid transport system substrate-binding protein
MLSANGVRARLGLEVLMFDGLRLSVAAAALFVLPATAHAASNPVERTEDLVRAFKTVKPVPDDGSDLSAADRKGNAAAFAALDGFFDWDALTSASINSHKAEFKAAELAEFKKTLKELIRLVAYPGSSAFFETAQYELKMGKKRTKASQTDVEMLAELPEQDLETTVTFHWQQSGRDLRIVDVSFDGASLTKDYRAQFGRIIGKDGVDGLMSKLRKRYDSERKSGIL